MPLRSGLPPPTQRSMPTVRLPYYSWKWLLLCCDALRETEYHHCVSERVAELEVAAAGHSDELLTAVHERHRCRVTARSTIELPEELTGLRVIGVEVSVAFTSEGEAAGGGKASAHHRLRHLVLPCDLASLQINSRVEAVLLLTRDRHERRAEPQLALFVGCRVRDVV